MKEYVRRVKLTVEESWLDPEEMVDGEGEGSSSGDGDIGDAPGSPGSANTLEEQRA